MMNEIGPFEHETMDRYQGVLITLVALTAGVIGAIVTVLAMPDVCEALRPTSSAKYGITIDQISNDILELLGFYLDDSMSLTRKQIIQDYFLKHFQ